MNLEETISLMVKQLHDEIEVIKQTLRGTQEVLNKEMKDTGINKPHELTGEYEKEFIESFYNEKLRPNVVEEIKEKDAISRPGWPLKPEGTNKGIGSLWVFNGEKYELTKKGAYKMFTKVGEEGMKINDINIKFKEYCIDHNIKPPKRDKLKEVLESILSKKEDRTVKYDQDKIFNVSLR